MSTLEQGSLLDLLANDPRREQEYRDFTAACKAVRMGQREYVSINAVRDHLSNQWGLTIDPRRYSSFWSRAVKDGNLQRLDGIWEDNNDSRGRNSGKRQRLYRWVGGAS